MNVLLVSIDSLRRDFLGAYRDRPRVVDYAVETPNFDRFADRACVFDAHYAGSLPCMPARREWHAGVQEFLWRPWGPLEPFDSTLPVLARESGTLTQLITDHFHYFQYGSHGYYEGYNGFEFVRGHEYDAWKTSPKEPDERMLAQAVAGGSDRPEALHFLNRSQYARNAAHMEDEEDFFAPRVFSAAADWLAANREWDEWFCYVDSFDIHEPFHCPEPYASMYTDEDPRDPELTVWPYYGRVDRGQSALSDRELAFVQSQYAGKATMVDRWFGEVLDRLDEEGLWNETMVVVTSDHGFCLGDHGWVAKNHPPMYDVLARTPLLVWHPEGERNGERTSALTSAVDLYATVMEAVDAEVPGEVHSRSLIPLLRGEVDEHREWALYGYWGTSVNVTDGRHTYHHPGDPDEPTYCYSTTMMNADSFGSFTPPTVEEDVDAGAFLPYTDSMVWRFPVRSHVQNERPLLFDTRDDPAQEEDLTDEHPKTASRMRALLVDALAAYGAPDEQFDRLELAESRG